MSQVKFHWEGNLFNLILTREIRLTKEKCRRHTGQQGWREQSHERPTISKVKREAQGTEDEVHA